MPRAHAALQSLLESLFDESGLRIFLRDLANDEGWTHDLRGPPIRLSELVADAIDLVVRHGLLDAAFFAALRVIRPHRCEAIERVASDWQVSIGKEAIEADAAPPLEPATTDITTVTRDAPRTLARLLLSEPNAILRALGVPLGLTAIASESREGFAGRLAATIDELGAGPEAAMQFVDACYSALSAVDARERSGARRILQRILGEWLPQHYGRTVVARPLQRTAAPDRVDDLDLDTPNREIAEPAAAFADSRQAAYATRTMITPDGVHRRVVGPRGEIPTSTAAIMAEILTVDERADRLAHALADQIPGPTLTTPARRLQDTREYLAFLRDPGLEHAPKHIALTTDERGLLGEDALRRLKDIFPALRIVGLGERPGAEEARIRFRLLTIFQDDDA